ncbi:MAG TPA: hypothetical protein VLO07_05535 [Thermoanaerobaculia bacterium]|nr:hypothetical protein [Thermoanaerobaculia bacterium]
MEALAIRFHSVPWLCGVLVISIACGEKGDPVLQTLDEIVKRTHARDTQAVLQNLTADFRDESGQDRSETEATIRRYFAAYESLNVTLRDVAIERAPNAAHASFRAEISGQPRKIGGLEGLLPRSSTYRFDLRLVPEEGKWKIAWASWQEESGGR